MTKINNIKVLFVAPFTPNGRFSGGIASFANSICNEITFFKENGIDIYKISNSVIKRSPKSSGKINFKNFLNYIKSKKQIKKQIKIISPDIVYLNSSFGIPLLKDLMLFRRKRKYKLFVHIHFADINNILTNNKFIKKQIFKRLKAADKIVFLSQRTRNDFVTLGLEKEKTDVLYNFYNGDIRTNNICRMPNKDDPLTLLFLGSIDKRKGFYDLIEAIGSLKSKPHLIVCGKPNDSTASNYLKPLLKEPWFDYKGYVSGKEKEDVFKQSDVLILPSYAEGLPISIIEGIGFGLAIVSTTVGAIPEIIDKNGVLLKPGDIKGLANVLTDLMTNHNLLLGYKTESLNKAKQFNFNQFKVKLVNIIKH